MKTILIVEDDRWLADSYSLSLERAGYKVIAENNAQSAIEVIDETDVDLVLLDIFLPSGNGIQFLQELRSYSDSLKIPVIVCSTASRQIPAAIINQFGVMVVLDKTSLTPAELRQAIAQAVPK